MARQQLGDKKVKKLREQLNLPIVKALVRGGTDHRIDLCLEGGDVMYLFPDGLMEKSDIKWDR